MAQDFGGQFRSDALVGVDDQNPLVGCLGDSPILEIARVNVFALDDAAIAQRADDFEGAVGRAGIGDEDFVGDMAYGFDAGTNVFDFVFARNQHGEAIGHGEFLNC